MVLGPQTSLDRGTVDHPSGEGPVPDAGLVARASSGDRDAFGDLVERHQPMAVRVAFRMVSNEDTARELAQEAILQAYLSLDRLRDRERFQSWLFGIVLNICRSHI